MNDYLEAGVDLVWIVNPQWQTIRVYRNDGTTDLFHADDVIENEPLLPGFVLKARDAFPENQPAA